MEFTCLKLASGLGSAGPGNRVGSSSQTLERDYAYTSATRTRPRLETPIKETLLTSYTGT
jgi:hypothetical protein